MDKSNIQIDLVNRLKNVESTQLEILKKLEDIQSENIPQNGKGV